MRVVGSFEPEPGGADGVKGFAEPRFQQPRPLRPLCSKIVGILAEPLTAADCKHYMASRP